MFLKNYTELPIQGAVASDALETLSFLLKTRELEVPSRRSFLTSVAVLAASLPFAGWARHMAAPVSVRRYGKFFLVNGWVLTAEDVEALKSHVL